MLAVIIMLIFALFLVFLFPAEKPTDSETEPTIRKTPQMRKLWTLAQTAMKERKPLKAEKALLTILKFDQKNAAAYNRLGIIYAKARKYKEAIECFEIAESLDHNASSLHNVGLIYLETENYEKASMAFRQAISTEGDVPTRYIAYAKAEEHLGKRQSALESLEIAYDLSPSTAILRHILEVHERSNNQQGIAETKSRIATLLESQKTPQKTKKRRLAPKRNKMI